MTLFALQLHYLARESPLVQTTPHEHEHQEHYDGECDDCQQTGEPTENEIEQCSDDDNTKYIPKRVFHFMLCCG